MYTLAPDQTSFGIPLNPDSFWIIEGVYIAIGGDPHQRQVLALRNGPTLNLHLSRRGTPVGNAWTVRPQDLLIF